MISPVAAENEVHEVVSPLGRPAVEMIEMAPRLDTLEGKTIGELWNGGFRGDESFPIIEKMLRERYPTVKLIPYTEFSLCTISSLYPEKKEKTLKALRIELEEKGCDAVITGNGA
jgi:hypothetical protein